MAVCDPVTRESLLENFRTLETGTDGTVTDNLRTLIVGRDLAYRQYVDGGQGLIGAYDEGAGVSATWPGLGASETVDSTTVDVVILDGLVNYYSDTATPPTASQGARNGSSTTEIIHDSGNTIFTGLTTTLPVAAAVGDYIKLDDGSGNTLETTIAAFSDTGGATPFNVIQLADSIPAAVGANFNLIFAEIAPNIPVDSADYTPTATTITLDPAITWATVRTGSAYPVIAGQTYAGADYSEAYTSYGAFRTTNATGFLEITSPSQLDTYFVGWEYPESGLGFAVARALAPLVSPETTVPSVIALALDADTTQGWTDALGRAQYRYDWYSVAPLSTSTAVTGLCETMINARVAAGYASRMFIGLSLATSSNLFTGALNCNVDDSQTSGEQRTVTAVSGSPFAGAVASDTIVLGGTTYVIASVLSNQLITITTAVAGGPGVFSLTSVDHILTVAEQASDYYGRAAAFDNRAVSVVFPPDPTWLDQQVDVYHLCAATAGLRGYTVPQQALKGVVLESGWEVPSCAFEYLAELENLAEGGCFVYEASISSPDDAVVAFTNTTDQGGEIIDSHEGMAANSDAVDRFFKDFVCSFEGRNKVTLNNLGALSTQASSAMEKRLRTDSRILPFGSVIVSGSVGLAVQSTTNADEVTLPYSAVLAATAQRVTVEGEVTVETAV